jgi:ribosome modulation factor
MARKLGKTATEKAEKKKSDKQRVKDTVAEVEASKIASEETKRDFFARARDLKSDLDEAATEARVAAQARNKIHQQYRGLLKEAGKAGVNSTALAEAITDILPQDPIQFARHVKAVNEFLVIAEYPLEPGSGQYGLFEDGTTVSSRVDQAKLDDSDDIETAKEKGYIAGKAGKPEESCPYTEEGSPEALAWIGRHRDAQKENLSTLGRGNGSEVSAAAH